MSADTGIDIRHKRGCASREGRKCDCKPSFQASVFDKRSGKLIRKTFATKTGARQWRQGAYAAVRKGDLSGDRGPTLNEALDRWLAALSTERTRSGDPYKPNTVRSYERTVRRFGVREALGHMRVREIRTADAQRWIDSMVAAGEMETATIDTAVTPLKAFYRRALVRGEATIDPFADTFKPGVRCRPRRFASAVDAAAMLAALDERDRPLWATAIYAGLRRGELIGLRREDIDLATGIIHVRRGWDMLDGEVETKSRKGNRKVPIPSVLRGYLEALPEGEMLFGTPGWVAKTNERARQRWEAAGLPVITLHEARHTYASLMIAAGVNAKALSTFLGHATIAITLDLYGHLMPGSEDEAAGLLDAYITAQTAVSA